MFGQESTIVLKDGRTIKGTIVFETEHEYTVRVVTYIGGGNEFEKIRSKRQVKILKSDILTNELTNEHNIPDDIEGIYERWYDTQNDPCIQAKIDAQNEVNDLWYCAYCLPLPIGMIAATFAEPNPNAFKLAGKSSDYVAVYTGCYRIEAKILLDKKATIGYCSGVLFSIIFGIFCFPNT